MTPEEMAVANARIDRLACWRFRQINSGYEITKGSGVTLRMTREEAENVVAQLGMLLTVAAEEGSR